VLQGYRIYNTWCGDPSKLILLEKAVEVIKRDNLLDRTKNSGVALQKGLNELQVRFDLYMYSELCPRGRNL
jgi:4-aminobutyrate aminotransferase/(S)-3-amino-2-methylpropionate transaminase